MMSTTVKCFQIELCHARIVCSSVALVTDWGVKMPHNLATKHTIHTNLRYARRATRHCADNLHFTKCRQNKGQHALAVKVCTEAWSPSALCSDFASSCCSLSTCCCRPCSEGGASEAFVCTACWAASSACRSLTTL